MTDDQTSHIDPVYWNTAQADLPHEDPWDLDADAAALQASDDDATPEALLWTARQLWRFLVARAGSPREVAAAGTLTTDDRRALLDWLGPVEKLVAFILHAMALALLASGYVAPPKLPQRAARAGDSTGQGDAHTACPPPDPANPDSWRCAFRTTVSSRDPFDRIDPDAPDAAQQIKAWFEHRRERVAKDKERRTLRQRLQQVPAPAREDDQSPDPDVCPNQDPKLDALDPPAVRTFDAWSISRRMEALFRVLKDPMRAARRLAAHYARMGRVPSFGMPPRHRHPWPCSSAIDRAWSRCRDLTETWRAGRLPALDTA